MPVRNWSVLFRKLWFRLIHGRVIRSVHDIECHLCDVLEKPSVTAALCLLDEDGASIGVEVFYTSAAQKLVPVFHDQVVAFAELYDATGVYVAFPRFNGQPQQPTSQDLLDYEDLQVMLSQTDRVLCDVLLMDTGQILSVKAWWRYAHGSAGVRAFDLRKGSPIELRQCYVCGVFRKTTHDNDVCDGCVESIASLKSIDGQDGGIQEAFKPYLASRKRRGFGLTSSARGSSVVSFCVQVYVIRSSKRSLDSRQ